MLYDYSEVENGAFLFCREIMLFLGHQLLYSSYIREFNSQALQNLWQRFSSHNLVGYTCTSIKF